MVLPSPDSGIFLMKRDSPPASGLFLCLLRRPQAARALRGSTPPRVSPRFPSLRAHALSSRVFGTGEDFLTGMTLFSLFAAPFFLHSRLGVFIGAALKGRT